jgi:hypothetical protein
LWTMQPLAERGLQKIGWQEMQDPESGMLFVQTLAPRIPRD